jgi:hypothetical protein
MAYYGGAATLGILDVKIKFDDAVELGRTTLTLAMSEVYVWDPCIIWCKDGLEHRSTSVTFSGGDYIVYSPRNQPITRKPQKWPTRY